MARSCSFLLLLFLLAVAPRPTGALPRHRFDCGELGMQLLVFPSHGRSIRFKVLDEFGTRFDVANCSICLHRLSSGEDGSVAFFSGYKGCHVLPQENDYVLRVQLEELLPSGIPVTSSEVNMTCPKPGGFETLPERGRDNGVLLSHAGLLHHVSQSSLSLAGSHLSSHAHSEQVHALAQHEHGSGIPGIPPQPNPARPGFQESGGIRPVSNIQGGFTIPGVQPLHPGGQSQTGLVSQNPPSWTHPGGQTWTGLHPGFVSQNPPSLVNSGSQTQPGLRPGFVSQNPPSSGRPGGLNQPGHLRPGFVSQNPPSLVNSQPGIRPGFGSQNPSLLVNSGSHTQPGIRPGFLSQNPPSSGRPGGLNQPGHLRPGFVSQNPPSLVNSQPGLRPGFAFQNPSNSAHSGGQTRPGSVSQNPPGLPPAGAHLPAGFLRPGTPLQTQPGIAHSSFQPNSHTGFHPGNPSLALSRPGLPSWPGFIRPGIHLPPGLLHPGIHPQPDLLHPTALFYPSGGAGMQLTREQCQVPAGRVPCVAPVGRDGCIQAGCCYDDMDHTTPCYYGNTATVQCLREGQFVLVVPRGTAAQPYNVDSVRLAGSQAGCEPSRLSDAFVVFRFPVTSCGTTLQVIGDRLIYENQLISTIDVQGSSRGFITRDSVYILQARCIYNASDLLPLGMEVAAPTTATPLAMPGPLGLQLRIATDESYTSYHPVGDFPLVRVLRDPIFVEVRLLQKTDPNLVLVLHQCWASPGSDAASRPQWPILVDGCPFQGDNYRTRMVPVGPASPELPFPSHYQRFVISTFTFVEPPGMAVMEGEVYISCSASVCHLAQPEPCRPSCQLGATSRARRSPGNGRMGDGVGTVTSQGCVVFPKVSKRG
ncbi:ZP1 protein, partial [Campylorhamphus procurvoides]|nr:ZP1 protein [Campylorhamphus procurvoides]